MHRWRQPFEAMMHYISPNKYAVEVPLYTTRVPLGVKWRVVEENHVLKVYGEKPMDKPTAHTPITIPTAPNKEMK